MTFETDVISEVEGCTFQAEASSRWRRSRRGRRGSNARMRLWGYNSTGAPQLRELEDHIFRRRSELPATLAICTQEHWQLDDASESWGRFRET